MTRPILVLLAVAAFVAVVAGAGCGGGGVGDPCVPEQEYDTCFGGFQIGEVNVESKSFQCQTRLCLVNHFQGRVSCPYGQNAGTTPIPACGTGVVGGNATAYYPASEYGTGSTAIPQTCSVPGGATLIGSGSAVAQEYQIQVAVPPQVFARNTAEAVYCSCRCANDQNQTNDGAVYCQCPDNYTCTQLVSSIGGNLDNGLTGGYCMKTGTGYTTSQPSDCTVAGTCCQPTGSVCGMNGNSPCACPGSPAP
jgi:hypothetical protein